MKKYKVRIDIEALEGIQNITKWYDEAQAKLGKRFQDSAIAKIIQLRKDPSDFYYLIS